MEWLKSIVKKFLIYFYLDSKKTDFVNDEGLSEYDFSLLPASVHQSGITAMLRIKNEEDNIEACIESILDTFDEIVVVDNGSSDNTLAKVRGLIESKQLKHVFAYSYPHELSRLGDEHHSTNENSLHSIAYFYNWCLSKCTRSWVFKWDGDMVLPGFKKISLEKTMASCIEKDIRLWVIRGKTVYIGMDEKVYSVLPEEVNGEDMLFPNRPWIYYRKDKNWETLKGDLFVRSGHIKDWFFLEVKDARKDEFSHWSEGVDFTKISQRKAREYKNHTLIRSGNFGESDVIVYCDTIEEIKL